jgi:hypothetical protein
LVRGARAANRRVEIAYAAAPTNAPTAAAATCYTA